MDAAVNNVRGRVGVGCVARDEYGSFKLAAGVALKQSGILNWQSFKLYSSQPR